MIINDYHTFLDAAVAAGNEKLVKVNQFESDRMFVDYYFLRPGEEQKPHTHADSDKIYVVLEGNGTFLIGKGEHLLSGGEGAVAAAGVPHGVRNHTERMLVLLVVMAPHPGIKPKP
ncbi:MAG: cupin domain-containing protein [Candidatus Kapaibacterium sp.]